MSSTGDAIGTFTSESRTFEPSAEFRQRSRIPSREAYEKLYRESIDSPDTFWQRETAELVFRTPWKKLLDWKLPHARWFVGSQLNVTESCLDRHLSTATREKAAIIWESEPGEVRRLSYAELHDQVVRFAAALRSLGVNKGDRVAIYMGMVPETVAAMLACARIGAPHSVVFGGFTAASLRDRIEDAGAVMLITADGGFRGGKIVELKEAADKALSQGCKSIRSVIVLKRTAHDVPMKYGRDI
ncbi:MAG TPA: AMP-binding protein, partial [Polyangiaceae bacterium]